MIWKAAVFRSRKEADNESKSRISDEKPEEDFTAGSSGIGIGAVFILLIHENPLEAYAALFKGAFVGKLKIGINSGQLYPAAFDVHCICSGGKAGAFNVGVEGEVFLGGMAAAMWESTVHGFQSLCC